MSRILLVEDNDDDVLMVKRALKKGKVGNDFHRAENGKIAIDYLKSDDSKNIELILLDLNMEVLNGFEFLEQRQSNTRMAKIPVVILTSSHRNEDVEKAYNLGANSYVEKPMEPAAFIEAILKIEDFWLFLAKKPK
ncbi:response regulator [Methanococcoides sp. SA1]|nr:response regulator [Methanococcoides sp. SA1]